MERSGNQLFAENKERLLAARSSDFIENREGKFPFQLGVTVQWVALTAQDLSLPAILKHLPGMPEMLPDRLKQFLLPLPGKDFRRMKSVP